MRGTAGLSQRLLPRSFYLRPALRVAPDLIGRVLVHQVDGVRLSARIVETEAYQGPEDRAAHSFRGRTARTEPMFGPGGHAYVYLVYGMHHCFNVVTAREGTPHAVLIRAVEPLEGIEWMQARAPRCPAGDLGRGPGRLARALGVTLRQNRADLVRGPLWIEAGAPPARRDLVRGPRIGVDYAAAWARRPWRFGWRGHPALSRPFPAG